MKLLVIIGTQLRHRYLLATLARHFDIAAVILYERTLVQPQKLPVHLFPAQDLDLERSHLGRLADSEQAYFADRVNAFDGGDIPTLTVADAAGLNSDRTAAWARDKDADVMFDFGSGIIRSPLIQALPEWKINLHGGLSPWYRGSATLFWPLYMQQPELMGATFHVMSERIDGGDILQHVRPTMTAGDAATDIMCRCITETAEVGVKLLKKLRKDGDLQRFPQRGGGKLFVERDYKPSCVRVVREQMAAGLIGHYLQHKARIDAQYQFVDQLGE